MNASDAAWALRFGQAGRMHIGVEGLRTATWIADRAGNVIELHLIGREKCIITLWGGDPATLNPHTVSVASTTMFGQNRRTSNRPSARRVGSTSRS